MSLRNRLLASFLAVVALLILVVSYQLLQVERLKLAHLSLAEGASQSIEVALELLQEIDAYSDLGRRYLVLRDPAYVARMTTLDQNLEANLTKLDDVAEPDLWSASTARSDFEQLRSLRTLDLREADLVADVLQRNVLPAAERLRERLSELLPETRQRIEERTSRSVAQANAARGVAWLSAVFGTVLGIALALWLSSSVSRPLERLVEGTREIASGNFEHRVFETGAVESGGAIGSPEIQRLSEDFDRMTTRLGELDQLKRDFVTSVSHDLKTPLASMQDTLQLVLDGSLGQLTPKQRRMLELNFDASERLRQMIMDLLDLARLESGSAIHEREPVDLAQVIEAALQGAGPTLRQKQLDIDLELPEDELPIVLGDAPLLTQLVSNLVTNAAQAAPEASGLRLGFAGGQGGVELWVEDDGPGVAEEDRERIFERFQRNRSRRGKSGTGLGLTIARAIAEAHDGTIHVGPARPQKLQGAGPGARFVVTLAASPTSQSLATPFAALLCCLGLALAGCSAGRGRPEAAAPAQPPSVEVSDDADLPGCSRHLARGQPGLAIACFDAAPGDASVLQRLDLALALLHPENDSPDWRRARTILEEIRDDAGPGPEQVTATVLVQLQREIERLLDQLRKLRELDLSEEPR
ncbi:MAG: ATP-binding protein [Acidobacteriota bacterium]